MKNIDLFGLVVLPAFCCMIIIGGLWHIDVSVHTPDGYNIEYTPGLTNGFWNASPVQTYHLGLWAVCFGLLLLVITYGLMVVRLVRL